METRASVAIIGTGAVAHKLSDAMSAAGLDVRQVYGRRREAAAELAAAFGAQAIDSLGDLDPNLDYYIIMVSDNAVAEVAKAMPPVAGIVAHTAGSVSSDVFAGHAARYGVLYPLGRFSMNADIDIADVTFFCYSPQADTADALRALVEKINPSRQAIFADDQQRGRLHLAAVWACNFTNHLFELARRELLPMDVPLDVLRPIVDDTVVRAFASPQGPAAVQTGPAVRHDQQTLDKHCQLIGDDTLRHQIYNLLTQSIQEYKMQQ